MAGEDERWPHCGPIGPLILPAPERHIVIREHTELNLTVEEVARDVVEAGGFLRGGGERDGWRPGIGVNVRDKSTLVKKLVNRDLAAL